MEFANKYFKSYFPKDDLRSMCWILVEQKLNINTGQTQSFWLDAT